MMTRPIFLMALHKILLFGQLHAFGSKSKVYIVRLCHCHPLLLL